MKVTVTTNKQRDPTLTCLGFVVEDAQVSMSSHDYGEYPGNRSTLHIFGCDKETLEGIRDQLGAHITLLDQ